MVKVTERGDGLADRQALGTEARNSPAVRAGLHWEGGCVIPVRECSLRSWQVRATPTVRKAPRKISRAVSPMPGMGRLRARQISEQPLKDFRGPGRARRLCSGALEPGLWPRMWQNRKPWCSVRPRYFGCRGLHQQSLRWGIPEAPWEHPWGSGAAPSPAPTLLPSGPWPRPRWGEAPWACLGGAWAVRTCRPGLGLSGEVLPGLPRPPRVWRWFGL